MIYIPPKLKKYCLVKENINGKSVICIKVTLRKKEYELCETAAQNYWANTKKGNYGKGLCNSQDDPYKPVRIGLIGQMAFSKILGTPVDLSYRQFGDEYDNLIDGYKIDIKCATQNFGNCLIYYKNEWGKIIKLDKDIYVFSFLENEDRQNKKATVIIVGYLLKDEIKECKIKQGKGGHLNYMVKLNEVSEIFKLINFFNDTLPVQDKKAPNLLRE